MAASSPPISIGPIADDLTGATDLTPTLSRGGMRVKQVVGVPRDSAALHGVDAVVVSLKSRTIPAGQAVRQSNAAAQALLDAGAAAPSPRLTREHVAGLKSRFGP